MCCKVYSQENRMLSKSIEEPVYMVTNELFTTLESKFFDSSKFKSFADGKLNLV